MAKDKPANLECNVYHKQVRAAAPDDEATGKIRRIRKAVVAGADGQLKEILIREGPAVVVRLLTSRLLRVNPDNFRVEVERHRNNHSGVGEFLALTPKFDADGIIVAIFDAEGKNVRFEVCEYVVPDISQAA